MEITLRSPNALEYVKRVHAMECDDDGLLPLSRCVGILRRLGHHANISSVTNLAELVQRQVQVGESTIVDVVAGGLDVNTLAHVYDASVLFSLFQKSDSDHNGTLDKMELVQLFHRVGVRVTDGEADDALARVDQNNDGVVTFPEFFAAFDTMVRAWPKGKAAAERSYVDVPFPTAGRLLSACQQLKGSNYEQEGITIEEAVRVFGSLGVTATIGDIHRWCDAKGIDSSSPLHPAPLNQLFNFAKLESVFHQFDADGSGAISLQELADAFNNLGIRLKEADTRALIARIDTDGDGVLTLQEFNKAFDAVESADMRGIARSWMTMGGVDTGSDLAPAPPPTGVTPLHAFIAGGAAGAVSRTLTAPIETVKLLAQTQGSAYTGARATVDRIISRSGYRGLFVGNLTNVTRMIPYSGIICIVYGNLLRYLPTDSELDPSEPFLRMMAGGLAGAVATTATHPLDVVRAQLTKASSETNGSKPKASALFQRIVRTEGLRGLYRGLTPTILAVAPMIAIQQATYDITKMMAFDHGMAPSVPLFLGLGAVAGATAQACVIPLEVVRRNMQVAQSPSTSAPHVVMTPRLTISATIASIVRKQGTSALFAGWWPSLAKVIPAAASSLLVRDAILGRL